jgi:hypothetical protein
MRRRRRCGRLVVQDQQPCEEDDVRVTTVFKRLLRLPGLSIIDVRFAGEGVIVTVALRRLRLCSRCGQTGEHLQIHDRRLKRWRHLDGRTRCVVECELRRLRWRLRCTWTLCRG